MGWLTDQPNIIFIFGDDYGYHDIGYHDQSVIQTPNMDQLAADGVTLNNYYVQPMCTPTRGTMMSGRYMIYAGLQHSVIQSCQQAGLPLEMPTIADALRAEGYATYMVGKWHIGFFSDDYVPTHRGFDSFFGYLSGGVAYYNYIECVVNSTMGVTSAAQYFACDDLMANYDTATEEEMEGFLCGFDLYNNETVAWEYDGVYSTPLFTEKAIDIIKMQSEMDKPFFLYLSYQATHGPLAAPDEVVEPYADTISDENRRIYAGMTTYMDQGIGNLTNALEQYGLRDNTIIIFSNDNGGDTNSGAINWPLRGSKTTLWEGAIKGIGWVNSPLLQKTGTINNGLMHVSDWFPTLVGLAGGDASQYTLDGFDIWDSISNDEDSPREEILINIDPMNLLRGEDSDISDWDSRMSAAIRVGDWKLITGDPGAGAWTAPPEDSDLESIADPDPSDKNIWLFNIADDPNETTDLFDDNQDQAIDMLNKLAEYQANAFGPTYPDIDLNCNPANFDDVWTWWQ